MSVDRSMDFDSFVVGPSNRLACEAARTTAESPGTGYNPLFIYSDTGLGKTHLLGAIANGARAVEPDIRVVYTPLESLLRELREQKAEAETVYGEAEILLIDDLQFLGNSRDNHNILFHVLDECLMKGHQVVLACDRPPLEMGELDDRLLSRFSGGLVVDIGRPNLDTRRSILERRLQEMDAQIGTDVMDAIARAAIENVRQLKGALHRVLALQRAEGREISADEVDRVLSDIVADPDMPWFDEEESAAGNEFSEFLSDVSTAVEEALTSPQWREDIARAILKWEAEGVSTNRLESYLDSERPVDARAVIDQYERDVEALRKMAAELERLDPRKAATAPLDDPDRLDELRGILEETRREKSGVDEFFLDPEKVIWKWPVVEERLMESWDDGD